MRIFKEGNNIRLQLMDMNTHKMLFDFTVPEDAYGDLKAHMIEYLNNFPA